MLLEKYNINYKVLGRGSIKKVEIVQIGWVESPVDSVSIRYVKHDAHNVDQ